MLFRKKPSQREFAIRMMGRMADGILELIKDGRSHDVRNISEELEVPIDRVCKVLDFLLMLGLVKKHVRITEPGRKFLKLPEE